MQGKQDCIHRIIILRTQAESGEDHNYKPLRDEAEKGGESVTPCHSTPHMTMPSRTAGRYGTTWLSRISGEVPRTANQSRRATRLWKSGSSEAPIRPHLWTRP